MTNLQNSTQPGDAGGDHSPQKPASPTHKFNPLNIRSGTERIMNMIGRQNRGRYTTSLRRSTAATMPLAICGCGATGAATPFLRCAVMGSGDKPRPDRDHLDAMAVKSIAQAL